MLNAAPQHILVIRAGALGDLVFCLQAFQDICATHPGADIALLTRAPFAAFAQAMPYFNRVIVDRSPRGWREWRRQAEEIKTFAPDIVFDLQGKTRQAILYALLGGPFGPAWSGAAPLCKYPRLWPPAKGMHFTEFLAAQLRLANVPASGRLDLGWLDAPVDKFILPHRYAVLIPGCSPGASFKRWHARDYAAVAEKLRGEGIDSVILGTDADADAAAEIKKSAPLSIDLCGKTSLLELAGILRGAACVVGNDTGPVHMAAALGAPVLALFSGQSSPDWSRPPGEKTVILQKENLVDLDVEQVFPALQALLHDTESEGG